MSIPVTIIGGYLGTGKTSLVNHLLRNANGKRLAVLVNEFGELPIDADLIEGQDGDVIALAGGCVCCSYGDDLLGTLLDMAKADAVPDHVLLEASGVAIPGAVAAAVSLLPNFELASIVALADVTTVRSRLKDRYVGDTVKRQFTDADLLLLNKMDLVDEGAASDIIQELKAHNDAAMIVPVVMGKADPDVVFGSAQQREERAFEGKAHDASIFATRSFVLADSVTDENLFDWLTDNKNSLIRAKGFAPNRVGTLQSVQLAGDTVTIAEAGASAKPGIALIGLRHNATSQEWLAMSDADFAKAVTDS